MHWTGNAFKVQQPQIDAFEQALYLPINGVADDDFSGTRHRFQSGCDVGCYTDDGSPLARLALTQFPRDHFSGMDADVGEQGFFQMMRQLNRQGSHLAADVKCSVDSACAVIIACLRIAEVNENAVAHVARDEAAEATNDAKTHLSIRYKHLAVFLGIEAPGHLRRSDQIAEHDRQRTAFKLIAFAVVQ